MTNTDTFASFLRRSAFETVREYFAPILRSIQFIKEFIYLPKLIANINDEIKNSSEINQKLNHEESLFFTKKYHELDDQIISLLTDNSERIKELHKVINKKFQYDIANSEEVNSVKECLNHLLTDLETSVLELYLEGRSYESIASHIGCEIKSVDDVLQSIKRKTALHLQSQQSPALRKELDLENFMIKLTAFWIRPYSLWSSREWLTYKPYSDIEDALSNYKNFILSHENSAYPVSAPDENANADKHISEELIEAVQLYISAFEAKYYFKISYDKEKDLFTVLNQRGDSITFSSLELKPLLYLMDEKQLSVFKLMLKNESHSSIANTLSLDVFEIEKLSVNNYLLYHKLKSIQIFGNWNALEEIKKLKY